MGKGIAVLFKKKFGGVDEIKKQGWSLLLPAKQYRLGWEQNKNTNYIGLLKNAKLLNTAACSYLNKSKHVQYTGTVLMYLYIVCSVFIKPRYCERNSEFCHVVIGTFLTRFLKMEPCFND